MPGQMMHLYVGKYFWEAAGYSGNRAQFLLGCIAPDGVNAKGFASKKIRWHAHLRDRDLGVWKHNAENFYRAHASFEDPDYLLGYLVHVYTDILWDEQYNPELERAICGLTTNEESRDTLRWGELFLFDRLACFQDWWRRDVRKDFARAKAVAIHGIPAHMIELLQKDTLFQYADSIERQYGTQPPHFVTVEQADGLSRLVAEQLKEKTRDF